MTFTTAFDLRQRVNIVEVDLPGRIVEIIANGSTILYNVQYFVNCEPKYFKFEEDELKAL